MLAACASPTMLMRIYMLMHMHTHMGIGIRIGIDIGMGMDMDMDMGMDMGMDVDDTVELDLTASSDDEVMKVFKKMGPEDEIDVVKTGDDVTLKDGNEEYEIKNVYEGKKSEQIY